METLIHSLRIRCVNGWGWSQRISESAELISVDVFPELLTFDEATLISLEDHVQFIITKFPSNQSQFGGTMLAWPLHRDESALSGTLDSALLIFGKTFLATPNEEIIKRMEQRLHIFKFPETRGFAQSIDWEK